MNVDYIKFLYKEDAITGKDGQCLSENNPPAYKVGDVEECKAINILSCCEAMECLVSSGIVGFGSRPENVYKNRIAEVFIRCDKGYDLSLPYCPMCKEPVMTHEVAVV